MVIYITIAVIILVAAIIFYRKKREKEMPAGLQVFDESGKVVVDMTSRTSKILGRVTVGENDGSLTDERLLDGNMWSQIESINLNIGYMKWTYGGLKITSNGSKLSWQHIDSSVGYVFIYGIY